MRVLLIYPPFERLKGFKTNQFPNNLGQLATCLEEVHHYARIYNADSSPLKSASHEKYSEKNRATTHGDYIKIFSDDNHPVWKEAKKVITDFRPDIVGISTMTATFPTALKMARIAKAVNKDLPVVMGGCHATVMPMDVIKRKDVDFVVQGEGELSLVQLCDFLDKRSGKGLGEIRGLYYKNNGQIIQGEPNQFINDLSSLPLIRRDLLLFPEMYNPDSYSRIMTSRGCPYQCTFCSSPVIWKRKVRYRKPEKIMEELNYLKKKYKVRRFAIWDDTFTANKREVIELCNLLKDSADDFNWACFVRANTVDKEILQHLKAAGCRRISIGIESGSDQVLKFMKKGITVGMVRKAVSLIKREGFIAESFWIMGIPYETEADMISTINLMKELDLDRNNLCTFTPEPMSELYNLCIDKGWLDENTDWAAKLDFSHHSIENYFNKTIPQDRYQEILRKALEVVDYCNRRTLGRQLRKFWLQRNYFLKPCVIYQRIKDYFVY